MPSVPPAAMQPVARASSYLNRFISGRATRPIVAAVAMEEPDTAEKQAQAPMLAIASPPGRAPNQR